MLAHHVTAEVNITLWNLSGSRRGLRQELARLWQPLFLTLEEALALYYREIADLGLTGGGHPGGLGRRPAPGPGPPPPEPGGGPRLAVCPGGVGGFGPGGLRRGPGRHQAPLEAGRGSGPPPATPRDLERALAALKTWLRSELDGQLLNYREGLKFQYFFPLVDQWLKQQEASLEDTLGSLLGSLTGVAEAMHLAEEDRPAPPAAGATDPRGPAHRGPARSGRTSALALEAPASSRHRLIAAEPLCPHSPHNRVAPLWQSP